MGAVTSFTTFFGLALGMGLLLKATDRLFEYNEEKCVRVCLVEGLLVLLLCCWGFDRPVLPACRREERERDLQIRRQAAQVS